MHTHLLRTVTFCALLCLSLTACTKLRKPSQCSSQLYGYAADSLNAQELAAVTFSSIEPYTTSVDSITRLTGRGRATQATFNTADGRYYLFSQTSTSASVALCRIAADGSIARYMPQQGAGYGEYDGIVWCARDEKMYGVKRFGRGYVLFEVEIRDNGYLEHDIIPPTDPMSSWTLRYPVCIGIDNNGDIYLSRNGAVLKYTPQTGLMAVAYYGKDLFALSYSPDAALFYGIARDTSGGQEVYSFISLSPTGTLTTIKDLPFAVNREYHSGVFDDCKNTYILSTRTGKNWRDAMLFHINADGTNTRARITNALYQGLAVRY